MNEKYDLTQGNIVKILFKVSLPVILTSFVQMAYNMTDLIFLSKASNIKEISNGYVAAAGFGGFFIWLGAAILVLVKIGTEVRVSQNYGRKDYKSARIYARTGVQLEFIFALIYALVLFVFAGFWMGLFNIKSEAVFDNSVLYLQIISVGMMFFLINPVFSASLNGTGNTRTPFYISASGLVLNMILDPILILVLNLDIKGAAIATVISQILVSIIFILYFFSKNTILKKANFFGKIEISKAKDILRIGFPVAVQSALFTFISMYIARMVAQFDQLDGAANAVQKVGSQIESLSWLTAGGLQTALGAFVGQNFGAGKHKRVLKGIKYALVSMTIYGVIVTLVMYFQAENLFKLFLNNETALPIGIVYLKIMAFSQLAMIIEATVGGALNGLGRTVPQSIVSLFFNFLRIPMAYYFIKYYGLDGIWISITISSILKGLIIYIWFKLYISITPAFKKINLANDNFDDKIMV